METTATTINRVVHVPAYWNRVCMAHIPEHWIVYCDDGSQYDGFSRQEAIDTAIEIGGAKAEAR